MKTATRTLLASWSDYRELACKSEQCSLDERYIKEFICEHEAYVDALSMLYVVMSRSHCGTRTARQQQQWMLCSFCLVWNWHNSWLSNNTAAPASSNFPRWLLTRPKWSTAIPFRDQRHSERRGSFNYVASFWHGVRTISLYAICSMRKLCREVLLRLTL